MKVKECREFIIDNLTKVRRIHDLELLKNLLELIILTEREADADSSIERILLVKELLDGELTNKEVRMLYNIRKGMLMKRKGR